MTEKILSDTLLLIRWEEVVNFPYQKRTEHEKWETKPVSTTVLFGEFEIMLDEKNRLLIPSEVRKALDPERDGEGFFLTVGVDRKPWLYPIKMYENMVSKLASELSPNADRLAFDRMNFAMTTKIEWDKQGRVLIPEKLVRRTELSREITMIGARDHLELWNRAKWDEYSEQMLKRREESLEK